MFASVARAVRLVCDPVFCRNCCSFGRSTLLMFRWADGRGISDCLLPVLGNRRKSIGRWNGWPR